MTLNVENFNWNGLVTTRNKLLAYYTYFQVHVKMCFCIDIAIIKHFEINTIFEHCLQNVQANIARVFCKKNTMLEEF